MNSTTHMEKFSHKPCNKKSSKPSKGSCVPFDPDPLAALRVHKLTQLYYVKTPTPGDGNCFYHGIIDQIENNPNVYETISELG